MSHAMMIVIALANLLALLPADAAQPSRPQAEYSADSVVQTEEGTIQQHVYVTPSKERREMLTGAGEGAVQILRYDTKVMWQLMPSEKMYMEHSIGGGQGRGSDPSQWTYEDTVMGEETLNGVKVTKYKTIATSTDGKKYGGFSWRTTEGINVKQDLLYKEGNEKKRMLTELNNLKIGRQDPQLFEIPEGFTKFDMGMMGMMGRSGMGQPMGRPDMGGTGTPLPSTRQSGTRPEVVMPQETPAPNPEPPAESEVDKATNFMKGLFGR
ncbi:hypothetical protein W02_17320 [Nitrospira sp. KM1]|uniref:DUF4412 domain-containing protein n=1 Tax=Nitrospira sp. KM1 TaxID=1936990 RepID=UPI0013A7397F|nr:DUF4412 domain-containing protein [Nitrospira sp. KM1]BCA54592.1 hypothetical protein W02_17320 [Nitrospira sp. KM1]